MDSLKLKNEFTVTIEDGAMLGHIEHIAVNEAAALTVCEQLTPENVSEVKFLIDGAVAGEFENVTLAAIPTRATNEDQTVTVVISLREKTEIEIRLDDHDAAIEDLGEAVSELMEG